MNDTDKITIPANRTLVILFDHVKPASTNSPGFIVDTATAYEWVDGRVYVHDAEGAVCIFEGVREVIALERMPHLRQISLPPAGFYKQHEVIEPAN